MKPYIIIVYNPTNRAYSMKRDYTILKSDLGIIKNPKEYVEFEHGWLPSFEYQRPDWVNKILKINGDNYSEFSAYWLY
jgi:hypothetical protein